MESYKVILEDSSEIDAHIPLSRFGLDFLLTVDICNCIGREFQAELAVFDIFSGHSLSIIEDFGANLNTRRGRPDSNSPSPVSAAEAMG